ncbi:MAG: hypothetical protein ACKVGW_01485 [Verrucomicrobiia bacterium]
MLIVMPDAHPVDPEARVYETYGPKSSQAFAKEMVNDILPFVEKRYNVQTKPLSYKDPQSVFDYWPHAFHFFLNAILGKTTIHYSNL